MPTKSLFPKPPLFPKSRRKTSMFASDDRRYGPRRGGGLPGKWILAAIPVGLLALELLLRVGVGIAGKTAELNAYQGEPANSTDYRFRALTRDRQPVRGIPGYGGLAATLHPLTGYQLQPSQQNASLQINAQGFRSTEDVPLVKPQNEVRILVLGDGSAFGSGTANNQATFAQRLEERLNQQVQEQKNNRGKYRPDVLPYFADEMEKALKLPPKIQDGRYRVINAAVPGYLSGNTLADFTQRLQAYEPNMVVLMGGYGDLLMPSDRPAAELGVEALVAKPIGHTWGHLREGVQGVFNHLYLTKALRYWVLKPTPSLAQAVNPLGPVDQSLGAQFTDDAAELGRRADRYQQNLLQLAALTQSQKLPLMVTLTPELHQRSVDRQSPAEKQRLSELGETYQTRVKQGYQALDQSVQAVKRSHSNVILVPLDKSLNRLEGEAFRDTVHLTDGAQTAVSDRLYETIAPMLQVKAKPFGS